MRKHCRETEPHAMRVFRTTLARVSDDDKKLAKDMIKGMVAAFRAKFGRDPEDDEPLLFSANSTDKPLPTTPEEDAESREKMAKEMEEAGIDPAIVYAYRKTGLIVMSGLNSDLLTEEELKLWDDAIAEYRAA